VRWSAKGLSFDNFCYKAGCLQTNNFVQMADCQGHQQQYQTDDAKGTGVY
jgi:hypothetical protein